MRLPVRCHAWNTVSRSGGREHGRSEDRVSQQKASALVTGRLAGPRGDRVSPEGRPAGGLCDSYPETDSCSHGRVLAEACTVVRSWATANRSLSPGREAELGPGGLARAVDRSRPRPLLEATSATTDQVALEALGLLQLAGYPKIPRAETASRLDNLGALPFEWADPEVWPLYSRGHTQAARSVCVFDAPEGAPHRIAPMASGLISLHSPSQARLSRPTDGAPASEEAGFYPCRRSGSPPEGG